LERNKDDPFYIAGTNLGSGTSSPFDAIICNDNGNDLDIDSIPVMPLDLEKISSVGQESKPRKATPSKARQRIQVAADETLVPSGRSTPRNEDSEAGVDGQIRSRAQKAKKSPLLVDSSNIGAFSLEEDDSGHVTSMDYERQHKEEEEMAKAMQEVEKLRLEMQRANERIQAAQGVPPEGTVVKKRTKKKVKSLAGETGANKKGRKIKVKTAEEPNDRSGDIITIRPKKVKKKKMEKQDIRGINADTNRDDIPQA
jgi:AP-3 complex subunit delta-1